MAEPCAVCSKVLKEAYRVRDRFGKSTQLGTVIVNLLDEALCGGSIYIRVNCIHNRAMPLPGGTRRVYIVHLVVQDVRDREMALARARAQLGLGGCPLPAK